MEGGTIETHLSVRSSIYEFKIDGKVLLLYHCPQCGRDFARDANEIVWRAARIGTFRVDFLPDQQWVSEPCPGVPFPDQNSTFTGNTLEASGSLATLPDSISGDPTSSDVPKPDRSRSRPRKHIKG
jgi:hypothetical protein